MVRIPPPNARDTEDASLIPGSEILWKRKWQHIPIFLTGKIPWTGEPGGLQACKESDTTKPMSTHACMLRCYYNS